MEKVTPTDVNGKPVENIYFKGTPDTCPICHHGVNPRQLGSVFNGTGHMDAEARLEIGFQCTRKACGRMFIGTYLPRSAGAQHFFALSSTAPKRAEQEEFPETIKEISPTFVCIYNQAIAAEAQGYDQLTGIGLRKALEFLVKDFACKEYPDQSEEIKQKRLAKCIKDHIDDANVRRCAERAAWLGNDETHYIRKWQDKDINDLKTLLRLTVNWLDSVTLTRQYIEEMEEGGPQAAEPETAENSSPSA